MFKSVIGIGVFLILSSVTVSAEEQVPQVCLPIEEVQTLTNTLEDLTQQVGIATQKARYWYTQRKELEQCIKDAAKTGTPAMGCLGDKTS